MHQIGKLRVAKKSHFALENSVEIMISFIVDAYRSLFFKHAFH